MFKTINESIRDISQVIEDAAPIGIIEETGVRYIKYLKFASSELADRVKDAAAKRDGVTLEVEGTNMYFPDEFTFNHIWYHYKAKIQPGRVTVEELTPDVKESVEDSYVVGRFTTTHTSAAFKHLCGYYGLTIERNPDGVGPRTYVAKDSMGQVVGNYMDGLGTFYNDKLPKIADEDFMGVAQAPEATVVDESTDMSLADRIDTFLSNYAKLAANYDPEYDDPDERWNGPDSAMMAMAANAIRAGVKPPVVHSDIGSGCYKNYFDPAVQAEHTAILSALDAIRSGQEIDEDVMVTTPEKSVKVTPSMTQLNNGAKALNDTLGYGISAKHQREICLAVYKAMVGNPPTPAKFQESDDDMGGDEAVYEDDLNEYGNAAYRRNKGWAILPATMDLYGKRVVDIKTAASEWAPHEETILVCTKDEGSRQRVLFLASSGSASGWLKEMNTTHECFHDQTQASKGFYTVVNVVGFKDGEIVSKVNDLGLNVKASVSVFK